MDCITKELAELILQTDIGERQDLEIQSRRALADYLGAAFAGTKEKPVQKAARFLQGYPGNTPILGFPWKTTADKAAFLNGFASHYLDLDDAQANLMGHGSTVIFSALLALADDTGNSHDFLSAYVAGSEVEGLLGKLINPAHKKQGWHPTATLGPIGAAAAIARWKKLSLEDTAQLLSLGATQSGGLGLEAGTDTKPLHSGFAASHAVWGYFLLKECGLTSSDSVFNNNDGWLKTISGKEIPAGYFKEQWLQPGQILSPGLWMKEHPYCSAAITGTAAVKALYQEGVRMDAVKDITFHFPPGKSTSLHYHKPLTGQQGRFSMEFVAWQVLTYGDVQDDLFKQGETPKAFLQAQPHFHIVEDLPPVSQEVRQIRVSILLKDGTKVEKEVLHPPGAPDRPFNKEELIHKVAAGTTLAFADRLVEVLMESKDWALFQKLLYSWVTSDS